MHERDLVLIGPVGNTHVASSLGRAAADLGLSCDVLDTAPAYEGARLARRLAWHVLDRRPLRRDCFTEAVVRRIARSAPRMIIAMGQAPLNPGAIEQFKSKGSSVANFATDDPFNPVHRASWHLRNLPAYDIVFTPRRSNMQDLLRHGCADVRYLPFGYDERLLPAAGAKSTRASQALFVGGADADRGRFFAALAQAGIPLTLAGGYWDRYAPNGAHVLGLQSAEQIGALTVDAIVNVCLVRRANRDGHVMRSFEIPAAGGFMLAEDTQAHREIFGEEGACVLYFSSAEEAAVKCRWAASHESERRQMASAARRLILAGRNSYRDRLQTMLAAVAC